MQNIREKYQTILDARPLPPNVIEYLPKGAVVGYEQFIGTSGKAYKVPMLADGKGGATRWMADVLWVELPLNMRMSFAMRGGGLLDIKDIGDIARTYGDKSTLVLFPEKE